MTKKPFATLGWPALLSLLSLLTLSGCGHSPPTRFLTLDPVAPTTPPGAVYAGPPIVIEAVHLPPALDRLEVAEETGANTLKVDDFGRWAAAPGPLGATALTADLAARLPNGSVVYPRAPVPATARRLVVDVLAFSDTGGQATLDVTWTVLDAPGSEPHVLVRQVERVSVASAGRTSAGVAADLSQLLGQLSDRIAAGLAARQETGPPPSAWRPPDGG